MVVNNWFETTIGEQATLQRGIDITRAEQRPGRVPVVSSGGISSYHDTVQIKAPGVVLGRKGVVGSVYYIPEDYWPHDTTLWVKDFHGNHPRFIYYFFKSIASLIARMDVGSANPTLNRNHVHPIKVLWPPIAEQKTIAHILGTLDDKIELNQQMNQTLEAIARALFKSWFIDFDPVRAKLDGRQPIGMDAETAALFPAEFEDSALGKIPKGWKVKPIGDAVKTVGGATPSTSEPAYWEEGNFYWSTPKDLAPLSSPVLLDTERRITEKGLQKISSGLLPKGTLLLSSRAPIGYLAIAEIPLAINQGYIAIVCGQELSNHYVLRWVQFNMDVIEGRANGTTFMEISKKNFRPIPALVPPQQVLQVFNNQAEFIHQQVVNNLRQNKTLASIRDALLPKLLSGEIRVQDAEKLVEAVT